MTFARIARAATCARLASLALLLDACGGEGPSSEPAIPPAPSDEPSAETQPEGCAAEATPPSQETGAQPSSGDPSSEGASGQCAPNAACGGLVSCVDHCYGERCCELGCNCDTATGRLHCGLTCD